MALITLNLIVQSGGDDPLPSRSVPVRDPPGAIASNHDNLSQLELEMDARKRELERMRLKYTGQLSVDCHQSEAYLDLDGESNDFSEQEISYQNVEFTSPNRGGDTLKTVLRFDESSG